MSNKCIGCGLCCKLFFINLSREEYESGQYQTMFEEYDHIPDFRKAREYGANLLAQNPDGSCVYLVDRQCTIHPRRPQVCRKFFCTSKAKRFQKMIKTINAIKSKHNNK